MLALGAKVATSGGCMRKISLKTLYLLALSAVFSVSLVAFVAFDTQSQRDQADAAMLEEARTFAREMDAVWQFMYLSQPVINNTTTGVYEFKGLHCAIVGKSVGALFSKDNDYTIRYTNFNPRSIQDKPDDFEAAALTAFNESPDVREYYGRAELDGEERFRYLQALKVDESCLECHGEPAGEIDITGKVKEGWTLASVGGAISIAIPLDTHEAAAQENIVRNAVFFLAITVLIGGVVYFVTRVFMFDPLQRMQKGFAAMGEGELSTAVSDARAPREIGRAIKQFNTMASELNVMYESLEDQVADRTEDLRRANAVLARQRDDLERLNKQLAKETQFKSDLLSMVNHELRTPLTSIITFAQISREACAPERESDRRSWEEIEKNSQILLNMINDMLDIARSDAGSMRTTCEPMDLGDVANAVRGTMAPLAQKYAVTFSTHVEGDVPLVDGDFEKTQRILENLASNAIKFTPDGGSVAVEVARAVDGGVVMRVIDTGIGIAEADQERIFDRFFQVDSTSTRKYNGSGLGLAIVREYAEAQGFSVAVQSTLGQGSTFTVTVPASAVVA